MTNDTRRPDPRRDLCYELASLLETEPGLRTAELLRSLELCQPPGSEASGPPPREATPSGENPLRPISIWRPRSIADSWVFERPQPALLGDHYADRHRIPLDKPRGVRRLCWFGESAAAGYLLAPGYTPAKALATHLGPGFEVLDFARTNEDLSTLQETLEASLQLSPDAWILFTGNNWTLLETPELNPSAPSPPGLRAYASAFRSGGPEGVISLARRRLRARAEDVFSAIAAMAEKAAIPIVLVVPEVNLADWDTLQPVPWLAGDDTRQWHQILAAGLQNLRQERTGEALAAAAELLALDGGRHPTAHRLRALAVATTDGEYLQACRRHVDEAHYPTMGSLGSPQAGLWVQDLLRALGKRFGWGVVDLPELFSRLEPVPGDALFFDYCHLTRHGIDLTIEATSATVCSLFGLPSPPSGSAAETTELTPEVGAVAELGAAIHGAHRRIPVLGDNSHLVAWLRRAVARSPEITDTLLDLAEARIAPGPEALTAAQQRNLRSPFRLTLQHGWHWEHLDIELLQAIQEVLHTTQPKAKAGGDSLGTKLALEIDRRLVQFHAAEHRTRDLSRAPYLWSPLERPFAEAMGRSEGGRRSYYRSLWPRSSFCLVSRGKGPLTMSATVRLPAIPGFASQRRGPVAICLDGEALITIEAGESWATTRFEVPSAHLLPGAQRLTLEWPPLPPAGNAARAHLLRELELGREGDLFPIFGEVYQLLAGP